MLSLISLFSCSSLPEMFQGKKDRCMTNIRFIPKEFETVKLGQQQISENDCSPLHGSTISINTLSINAPERIILKGRDSLMYVIPLCIRYSISLRRSLKYANAARNVITIKRLQDGKIYSGEIVKNGFEGELPFPDDYDKEGWDWLQTAIVEAQKYSDKELDEGPFGDGWMNINGLEYVNLPFAAGKYEIWLSFSGLESNHAVVEVVHKRVVRHLKLMNDL